MLRKVYITDSGRCYHKATCGLIAAKKKKAVSLEEAERKGLSPCQVCIAYNRRLYR